MKSRIQRIPINCSSYLALFNPNNQTEFWVFALQREFFLFVKKKKIKKKKKMFVLIFKDLIKLYSKKQNSKSYIIDHDKTQAHRALKMKKTKRNSKQKPNSRIAFSGKPKRNPPLSMKNQINDTQNPIKRKP